MKKFAPLFILLAGLLWGIIGLFSRTLNKAGFSPVEITESRCLLAGVCLILYLLVTDREKLKIEVRDLWMFLGTGILSIVFFNICSFYTIAHTTMAVASMLLYTAPCMVMLMSAIFFKEKITGRKVLSLLVALAGCVFITDLSGMTLSPFILLTGLGAGFGYALYSIFSVPALRKYSPVTITVYTFIVASFSLMPFATPVEIIGKLETPEGIGAFLGIGILSTLLPYLLYTKGLQYTEAGKASVIAFSEPLCATLTGILVFHETLTLLNALGILCIFGSILLISIKAKKQRLG